MAIKEYHSFGGVWISLRCLAIHAFGEMQMVSYRADREKAPIHTMGSPDARSIARGKRYISGACVFTVFDRDTLLEAMDEAGRTDVWLSKHETANYRRGGIYKNINNGQYQDAITDAARNAIYGSNNIKDNNGSRGGGTLTADYGKINLDTSQNIRSSLRTAAKARLADQVLPFDINLVATKRNIGHTTKMVIYGVELMTESGGVSMTIWYWKNNIHLLRVLFLIGMPMDQYNTR